MEKFNMFLKLDKIYIRIAKDGQFSLFVYMDKSMKIL